MDKHNADHRVRQLTSKSQFLALLFAQLSGAASLREIEAGLIHSARLYHVGGHPVARTTLADANAKRPAGLFAELFAHVAAAASRPARRQLADAVRILDATRVQLSSLSGGWVDTVKGARAIKLHIVFDPRADAPLAAAFTGQRINDITPAKAMPIEPGMTYVFDLAYYDSGSRRLATWPHGWGWSLENTRQASYSVSASAGTATFTSCSFMARDHASVTWIEPGIAWKLA